MKCWLSLSAASVCLRRLISRPTIITESGVSGETLASMQTSRSPRFKLYSTLMLCFVFRTCWMAFNTKSATGSGKTSWAVLLIISLGGFTKSAVAVGAILMQRPSAFLTKTVSVMAAKIARNSVSDSCRASSAQMRVRISACSSLFCRSSS